MFVLAEVMDKEPTLASLWTLAIVIAIAGIVAAAFRWWFVFVPLVAGIIFCAGVLLELHDRFVGPAILEEAGRGYVVQAHIAACVAVLVPALAGYVSRRKPANQRPS